MALLFDEAQGAFKDTGSQASPMKKSTGLMRKQMSKMDEVAPRGHTLAYITPEEAEILNRGGGGIDAQGNQMTGPYGVPMYQGFVDRFRKSREASKARQSRPQIKANPHTDKPSFVEKKESKPVGTPRPHGDEKKQIEHPVVQKEKIIKQNFNTDTFMATVGKTVNTDAKTINEQLLINPHLNEQFELKEKGDGSILDRKNQVSNEIINHLKTNVPENDKEKKELLFLLDRFPKNVKDNVKKAIDKGEVSLDVAPIKSVTANLDKLSTGDFIFNIHADEPTTVKETITSKRDWYYDPIMFDKPIDKNMAGSEPVEPLDWNYIIETAKQHEDLRNYKRTPTGLLPPSILNPPSNKAKITPTGLAPPSILNPPVADTIKINDDGIVTGLTETDITKEDAKEIADGGWSIQNIQNWIPLNIRALTSDVWVTQTGIGDHKTLTEKNLTPKYITVLKEIVKRNLLNGKNGIEYADYETHAEGTSQYRDVDASVTDLSLITKAFSPAYNLKTTLGQTSITIDENNNVIIKDRYNFNNAKDIQSIPDLLNAAAIIGYEGITGKIYGTFRTIGTFFGSNDQEGAFVEINLGNYDELIKG